MKMKDQNAKKEKLKQKCDKAKHGLNSKMRIRPTMSHFWCVKARVHVKERKKKEEKGRREEEEGRKKKKKRKKAKVWKLCVKDTCLEVWNTCLDISKETIVRILVWNCLETMVLEILV